jgi:chlorobactene glucosyltransferase
VIQLNTIAIAALWFIAVAWLAVLVLTLRGLAREKSLSPSTNLRLTARDAPLVSVLVPARNEEDRVLADCIRSILAQDYGRFEVIAINDRSTDATGAILQNLAATDERLRVIDGNELPPGWLGKPYAMQQALAHARGEWILATDADMLFEPSALRTAVERAVEAKSDALTLLPHFEAESFWERVMIPTWAWVLLMFMLLYRVDDSKTERAAAIGGFFLVRRGVLDRVGGYEALKNEVMEDVRLAEMIKRSGARLSIHQAPALMRTRMYRTFAEMWECVGKNWFSGMNYSLPLAWSSVASMYVGAVAPALVAVALAIALALGADVWLLFIPAVLSWLFQVLIMMTVSRRSGVSPLYALTVPMGVAVMYAILFDSSVRITTGRGVTWKGRLIYERQGVRPPRSRAATMILGLLSVTIAFGSVVNAQKRSREEASKEAGTIVTAAERKVAQAHQTGNRALIVEAERATAEAFVNAIELWREAGDDSRLIFAVEELTRLYTVHGEQAKVVERLKSEANYWAGRGDVKSQLRMLLLLGIRQWQLRQDPSAMETLQQAIELSHNAGLILSERDAWEQLALVYTRMGRTEEAEAAKAKVNELSAIPEPPAPPSTPRKLPAETIPAQWVDLPGAPLVAEYRDIDGANRAVLTVKSTKGIELMMFGCVLLEENNKIRVLYGLGGSSLNHGGFRPGAYLRSFIMLNGPLSRWSDEKMGCEGAAKMAVIEATFDDRTTWKADGSDAVVRDQ